MWEKKGLIYCPNGENIWEKDTFMTPHAMLLNDDVIRIWGGVRDSFGVSRIKYIDVSADNPAELVAVSGKPSFDIGNNGCFDDNGVILGDIVKVNEKLYLYYVGFQHVEKVKFYAFSGLAISDDNGEHFERYSEVPIMDRTPNGRFGRCIHTVLFENNIFKIYYAVINDWKNINNIDYPVYNIWYTESVDGIHIPSFDRQLCIDVIDNEYRIGRPKVYKNSNGYEMFYTRDLISKDYIIGYATSEDGIQWNRKDSLFQLEKSNNGWDSQMTCYPVKLCYKDKIYLFYGGNGMGKTGVGYAEWYENESGKNI